jgi:hypothetical protein
MTPLCEKKKKIEKKIMMMWRFLPHHINLGLIYQCHNLKFKIM